MTELRSLALASVLAGSVVACSSDTTTTPTPTADGCIEPEVFVSIGGPGSAKIHALFVAADGSFTTAGTVDARKPGPASGQIQNDVRLDRFASDGTPLASKTSGTSANDYLGGATFGSDGSVFFAGMSSVQPIDFGGGPVPTTAGYVVKLDPGGAHVWTRPLPGGSPRAIARASDGSLWVHGATSKGADFGTGPLAEAIGFLAHLDAGGAVTEVRAFASAPSNAFLGERLAVLADGSVFLGGLLLKTADFGGGPLTAKSAVDPFLVRFDATGQVVYGRAWGTTTNQHELLDFTASADGTARLLARFEATSIDLGGGVLGDGKTIGIDAIWTIDGKGSYQIGTKLQNANTVSASASLIYGGALGQGADGTVWVSSGSTHRTPRLADGKDGQIPRLDRYDGAVTAGLRMCKPYAKTVGPTQVVLDGAGHAFVAGAYDVPNPTDAGSGLGYPLTYAFVSRVKLP